MKQNFSLPQLNYLIFELVRINAADYLCGEYSAEPVETVVLAVQPEIFSFQLTARDSITQTDSQVFLNKYDFAPEKCSM